MSDLKSCSSCHSVPQRILFLQDDPMNPTSNQKRHYNQFQGNIFGKNNTKPVSNIAYYRNYCGSSFIIEN